MVGCCQALKTFCNGEQTKQKQYVTSHKKGHAVKIIFKKIPEIQTVSY